MHAFTLPPALPVRSRRVHTRHPPSRASTRSPSSSPARSKLLSVLSTDASTRTGNEQVIASLVTELEASLPSAPSASDPRLLGTWRNLHTTLPASSSPIQRFVVSNARLAPAVEQVLLGAPGGPAQRLVNRVDLRAALGAVLNVAATVESVQGSRLSVRFDEAWFAGESLPSWMGGAKLKWRMPYPVPFKLLGDKVRGYLDVTYLDDEVRIARGSRGSTFVLLKRDVEVGGVEVRDYLEGWVD